MAYKPYFSYPHGTHWPQSMKGLIIVGAIVCVVVFIIAKVLKQDKEERTLCSSCGKPYGGNPAKCPHCGASLRWKER